MAIGDWCRNNGLNQFRHSAGCLLDRNVLGIVTFNIDGVNYTDVASSLADKAGIDVGKGTFGAQPYVFRLLGLPYTVEEEEESASTPGMVRVSLGVYNTEEEIDVLLSTVRDIAEQ